MTVRNFIRTGITIWSIAVITPLLVEGIFAITFAVYGLTRLTKQDS